MNLFPDLLLEARNLLLVASISLRDGLFQISYLLTRLCPFSRVLCLLLEHCLYSMRQLLLKFLLAENQTRPLCFELLRLLELFEGSTVLLCALAQPEA